MLLPAVIVAGPLFVTERSAEALTVAELDWLLLPGVGSLVVDDAEAVFVSVVLFTTFAPTFKTSVKVAEEPEASVPIVQFTEPLAPTAGFVQLNAGPVFCASETNVVPAGSVSLSVTLCASLGPLFVTLML